MRSRRFSFQQLPGHPPLGAYLGCAPLTRTEAAWAISYDGYWFEWEWEGDCWANEDTFASTTWEEAFCDVDGDPDWLFLLVEAQGDYINWDFWDDDEETTVCSVVEMEFSAFVVWLTTFFSKDGEWEGLITEQEDTMVYNPFCSIPY